MYFAKWCLLPCKKLQQVMNCVFNHHGEMVFARSNSTLQQQSVHIPALKFGHVNLRRMLRRYKNFVLFRNSELHFGSQPQDLSFHLQFWLWKLKEQGVESPKHACTGGNQHIKLTKKHASFRFCMRNLCRLDHRRRKDYKLQ